MNGIRRTLLSIAIGLFFVSGCTHQQPPAAVSPSSVQATPTHPQPQPAEQANAKSGASGTQDASVPDGPAAIDVLARKAESYSKSVEAELSKRRAMPAAQESAVQWMNKDEFTLSHVGAGKPPTPAENAPLVRPAIDVAKGPAAPVQSQPIAQTAQPLAQTASTNSPGALQSGVNAPALSAQAPARATASAAPAGTVQEFEAKLAKRVQDYPRDLSAQLEYQLWLFLRDQPVPSLATVSSLPSEDREVLAALLDGLTNFRNGIRADSNMLLSKKIKPLVDAIERIRSQADLCIPTIALCTSVTGFGQYSAIEPRFPANTESVAILYCEVENFSSQLNEQQLWASAMKLQTVLYAEDSLQVWADNPERLLDTSRNRRHDFFVHKFIKLPKNLAVGRYLLKVTITDEQANRIAEGTLPIAMVAQ